MAAALLSVVSSLPPSEAAPNPTSKTNMEKIANATVKARRRAGREERGKHAEDTYPMFRKTWG